MTSPWIINGERVALRPMTDADQDSFCAWMQNEELRQLIDDRRVPTMEDQRKWFTRSQQPDRAIFSIVTLPEGTLIGNGGLVDIEREKHAAQLRITIGNPDAWGKGYGTEAVALIIRHALTNLGLTEIWLKVLPENVRAIKTYEKNGFMHDGTDEQGKILMRIHKPNMG